MENNNSAEMKYKQYICENSPELRDFERALQTAYNRQVGTGSQNRFGALRTDQRKGR